VRAWSIGVAHHFEIDTHGLAYANKIAFKRAWKYLPVKPDYVLFDYLAKINFETPFEAVKGGDKKILSIAAASILAKVFHDRMIEAFSRIYPEYGFSEHKGYGTALHLERLVQFGPSPIHRKSFGPVKPRLL
jgi:ribonuclease HII